jgi:hypothetical protein
MRRGAGIPILLSASFLFRPALISNADGADCFIQCMESSGCWSGGSVTTPDRCRNMPELCTIQCKGKANNSWGAIAYSRKDEAAGWSYEQGDKSTAERVALQNCVKQGGAKCQIEASFNHICGAIAADGDLVGWGTDATKPGAQQRAMAECGRAGGKKCAVQAWVCSAPGPSGGPSTPATPSAPPAPRATSWGAIAYSSADMGAGWSQGQSDRASAEKEAMRVCTQRGKACVLRTAFNKQCGALAADRDFIGLGTSTDQREAQQKAIDECKKAGGTRCGLHILFCSN